MSRQQGCGCFPAPPRCTLGESRREPGGSGEPCRVRGAVAAPSQSAEIPPGAAWTLERPLPAEVGVGGRAAHGPPGLPPPRARPPLPPTRKLSLRRKAHLGGCCVTAPHPISPAGPPNGTFSGGLCSNVTDDQVRMRPAGWLLTRREVSARNGETWMQTDRPGEALRRSEVFLPSGGTPRSLEGARPPLPHPNTSVRGSSWLKPPALARHHGNHLPELVYDRRSWNRTELIRTNMPPPTGRVREGSKGDTMWPTPPRILLSGLHLG